MEEGGFYDPLGVYFNEQGYDDFGGFYDDAGFYIAPKPLRVDREGITLKCYSQAEIETNKEGKYDHDGFYMLPDGSFYDPLGYYFD